MIHQGDAVIYKCKGVYTVKEVGTLDFAFADRKKEYYTLQSLGDERDQVYVPISDDTSIRRPMEKEAVLHLIGRIDEIEMLWVANEKMREKEYKDCISGYAPESWIRVLKTLYKRTERRGSITSMDKKYRQLLEHALYSEFSYALGIPENMVESFIQEQKETAEKESCSD